MPPGFDKVLPQEALNRLREIHSDAKLSWEQRTERVDEVMRSLPEEIYAKLPLPPGLDKLPSEYFEKVRALNSDRVSSCTRSIVPESRLVSPQQEAARDHAITA